MTAPVTHRPAPGAPLFVDDLAAFGDRVALVTAAGTTTYAELDERVRETAARLGPDRRLVMVGAANDADALVAYLAALRGGHAVLLVPGDDERAAEALAAAYDPDVRMTPEDGWAVAARRPGTAHDLHPDLALLLSTSGSTGSPKLVRLSRRNVQANAEAIASYLGIRPDDRAATTLPMHYCYGLSVVHSHLLAGAGLVLTDLSVVDRCFWDLFRAAGTTTFAGVPHTFALLDRVGFEAMDLPSLRYVTQAGGRLDPATVRRYAALGERRGWDLVVMYGQTEATARMAYLPPALAPRRPEAIGVPIPGGSFTLADVDGDGVGELVYRGPNVMLGYAEGPADLALGRTVDALRTGDLARRTADGLYEVVGRRSRFVKLFGLRVDLDRLERLLADEGVPALCAGDDDGVVVAVGRGGAGRAAPVARRLGIPRSHLRVVEVADLPRLPNGKPDYCAVRRLAATPDPPPRPGLDAVRAAYAEVLGVEPRDDDTFVSLGGDSLSYVEASIRLEAALGDLPRDWHTRPVAELAPAPRRARLACRTETSVVLRAVAIVLVVGSHAELWEVPGGAHALLAVAGFNFARFQLRAAPAAAAAAVGRVAIPAVVWIALVAAASADFGWRHALLLNGPLGGPGDRWAYWYVEALVHVVVVVAVVTSVPMVRRLERARPFAVALAAVGVGLAARFDVVGGDAHHRVFRPDEVFWLFALGWAAAAARTTGHRLVVSLLLAAAVPGFFADGGREALVAAAVLLLVWVPALPVPRPAGRVLGAVAGASLYVYLTHWETQPPVLAAAGPVAGTVVALAAGVAAWRLAGPVVDRAARALASKGRRAGTVGT